QGPGLRPGRLLDGGGWRAVCALLVIRSPGALRLFGVGHDRPVPGLGRGPDVLRAGRWCAAADAAAGAGARARGLALLCLWLSARPDNGVKATGASNWFNVQVQG